MIRALMTLLTAAGGSGDPLTVDVTKLPEPELKMLYEKAFKRLDRPHVPFGLLSQFHALKDELERRSR